MIQEEFTTSWENISVLFSQPGGSPILLQPGEGDKNFSQEGCFCLTKKRGGWNIFSLPGGATRFFPRNSVFAWPKERGKKAYDQPHT